MKTYTDFTVKENVKTEWNEQIKIYSIEIWLMKFKLFFRYQYRCVTVQQINVEIF